MPRSFLEFAQVHRTLGACFLKHQEALIERDMPKAKVYYLGYRDLLLLHMHHEDDILLPIFARKGPLKRWPPQVYTGEHGKLKGMLRRIETGLDMLNNDATPAEIVAQIDLEGGLKRLLEHHEQREEENLFLVLDEVTHPEERDALVARCLDAWLTALADSPLPLHQFTAAS